MRLLGMGSTARHALAAGRRGRLVPVAGSGASLRLATGLDRYADEWATRHVMHYEDPTSKNLPSAA